MALINEYAELDEIVPGQFRHTQNIQKIAYRENGSLSFMDQNWENSGIPERPHQVVRAPIMVTTAEDGMRRIHITRELDRYFEIGAPFVKTGGVWGKVNLGAPTRTGSRLQWTRPNANMYVDFGGHFIKLAILLKGGFMPEDRQIAFPVDLVGFTRSGLSILREGVPVGRLNLPVMIDFADTTDIRKITHTIENVNGQPYWLMTLPDITGMSQPVIDPTLSLQPDSTAGYDTYIVQESPTANSDADTNLYVGESNGSVQLIRTLIKFDLSTLPAAAIFTSAILSLFCNADQSNNARTFRVYRQKRAWVDTQATWNIYSTGNSWQTAGGFGANDCEQTEVASRAFTATETINQFKDFPFSVLTKAELDLGNGWLIKADTESNDRYAFRSSEHATALERPKLVIDYVVPVIPVRMNQYRRRRT